MATITIQGYDRECTCDHCGRPLKLGVQTSELGVIGADCFVKLIASDRKRYSGNGKPGSARVREYAIIASKGDDYASRVHNLPRNWRVFTAKELVPVSVNAAVKFAKS